MYAGKNDSAATCCAGRIDAFGMADDGYALIFNIEEQITEAFTLKEDMDFDFIRRLAESIIAKAVQYKHAYGMTPEKQALISNIVEQITKAFTLEEGTDLGPINQLAEDMIDTIKEAQTAADKAARAAENRDRDERFKKIKELIGQDKHLAYLVEIYAHEAQVPSLEEQQENIKYHNESLSHLLTAYEADTSDDSKGSIYFKLGDLEVEFTYHGCEQTLDIGEHTIDLDTHYFKQPSIFRNYINEEELVEIETICKEYFPDYDPTTVTACILELIGNRDPCAH